MELLYCLGHILTIEFLITDCLDLRRLLGWTQRQYLTKSRIACRTYQLFALCGRTRIGATSYTTPSRLQNMCSSDFNKLLEDIIAYQTLNFPFVNDEIEPNPEDEIDLLPPFSI